MRDDPPATPDDTARMPWWQQLERTKLTPLVFVIFFGALPAMSGAAPVGYLAQQLGHPGTHTGPR